MYVCISVCMGRLGSAALVGSQSRRRTTPIRNPRVQGVLDRFDVSRPWVYGHVCAFRNRALSGRFLSQRLGEGHSDRKPTASWSPQPSQPAEPLWRDPQHKEWNWCARADVHYKRLVQAGRKGPAAMEKRRKRQVLDGTGSRSLNFACRRLSCIGRLSVDLRQQHHSAAL